MDNLPVHYANSAKVLIESVGAKISFCLHTHLIYRPSSYVGQS
jgi:hypothetical protein